jgi:hypothetical protein
MKLQIIHDAKGNNAGVFIPIEDWNRIKSQYPDIEHADFDLNEYEKDLIDLRLEAIEKNPQRLKSGEELFRFLKKDV